MGLRKSDTSVHTYITSKRIELGASATYETPITMTFGDFLFFFVSAYHMTVSKTRIGSIDINIL